MSKIVHKTISNMQKMGMMWKLQVMWCASTIGHDDKTHLEQVFDLIGCHPNW
jgi:hypothetical protein